MCVYMCACDMWVGTGYSGAKAHYMSIACIIGVHISAHRWWQYCLKLCGGMGRGRGDEEMTVHVLHYLTN